LSSPHGRKNGSEFPIEIMLSPLESAEGILVTAAIRDISTRKSAEGRLAQMEGIVSRAVGGGSGCYVIVIGPERSNC